MRISLCWKGDYETKEGIQWGILVPTFAQYYLAKAMTEKLECAN